VNPQTAFIWSAINGFTDLGLIDGRSTMARDINSDAVVSVSTGFSSTPGALAYLWAGGAPRYLGPAPGCMTSDIGVINDLGWASVSGMVQLSPLEFRSFLRRDDSFYLLRPPLPGGFSAGTLGITNSGLTSGHTNFGFPVQYQRATIWRDGQPIDLNTLLILPFAGVLEDRARISDNEIIVAGGENNEGEVVAFLLNPIPAALGDTDCDSQINIDDLLNVIAHWGPCAGCNPDLTRDGAVDIFDLIEVILNWGAAGGAP
jgi:hypothetical protein